MNIMMKRIKCFAYVMRSNYGPGVFSLLRQSW